MAMNEIPVVDWVGVDAALAAAERGVVHFQAQLGALTLDEVRRVAIEAGLDPTAGATAISLGVDLSGVILDLTRALRRAAPALARALGQDPEQECAICPRCGAPVPVCEVGTVACHRECGYCAHPAMNGDHCAVCDAERGTLLWADRQSQAQDPGCRILLEKGGTGEPPVASKPWVGAMGFGHD